MSHPLARYRESNELTLEEFAGRIGTTKAQVWKWENGAVPRSKWMALIRDATGGQVTANDWTPQEVEGAAA